MHIPYHASPHHHTALWQSVIYFAVHYHAYIELVILYCLAKCCIQCFCSFCTRTCYDKSLPHGFLPSDQSTDWNALQPSRWAGNDLDKYQVFGFLVHHDTSRNMPSILSTIAVETALFRSPAAFRALFKLHTSVTGTTTVSICSILILLRCLPKAKGWYRTDAKAALLVFCIPTLTHACF